MASAYDVQSASFALVIHSDPLLLYTVCNLVCLWHRWIPCIPKAPELARVMAFLEEARKAELASGRHGTPTSETEEGPFRQKPGSGSSALEQELADTQLASAAHVSSEPEPAPEERVRREAALVLEQCAARLAEAGPADDDGALQRALGAAEARWQAAVEAEWAALARRATSDE